MKKMIGLMLAFAMAAAASSHAADKKPEAVAKAAVAGITQAASVAGKEISEGAEAAGKLDFRPIFNEAMKTHHHNRLVHFPIALGLLGVVFALLAYRDEKFKMPSQWVLFFGALGAVGAYLTGEGAEHALDQMSSTLKQAVEVHEGQGLAVLVLLWVSWLHSLGDWGRKWAWVVYLATAFFISGAGMLGGIVAHMGL